MKLAVAQAGDSGVQFAADGKRILFESNRGGSQQVWLADFDAATGTASNARKLTSISTEADNAKWAPDGRFVLFSSSVYPDCPADVPGDGGAGDKCNADRDAAQAASKVKAQIFTHLLYRHWNHFTGDKRSHLFLVVVETGAVRDLTPGDWHDVPPFSLEGGGGFDISPDSKELAFTENLDPEPATSVSASIFTLDLTDSTAKPVKVSASAGGNFNPAYSPDGRYLAWRSESRAGYESDKFRLFLYDRAGKTATNLMPKFDNWVDEFAWSPDSTSILFASGVEGEAPVFSVDVSSKYFVRYRSAVQPEGEYAALHPLPDGRSFLATRMTTSLPGEIVAIQAGPHPEIHPRTDVFHGTLLGAPPVPVVLAEVNSISHLNDVLLAQFDLPKMESFWFSAADSTKVEGFLIRPAAFDPAKTKAALIELDYEDSQAGYKFQNTLYLPLGSTQPTRMHIPVFDRAKTEFEYRVTTIGVDGQQYQGDLVTAKGPVVLVGDRP